MSTCQVRRWLVTLFLFVCILAARPARGESSVPAGVAAAAAADNGQEAAPPKQVIDEPDRVVVTGEQAQWLDYYIVQLVEPPLATYSGGINGLEATTPSVTGMNKLDANSPASQAYRQYLAGQQRNMLETIEKEVGHPVEVAFQYDAAFNGFAIRLTWEEANQVVNLPGVSQVQRNEFRELLTDVGPTWIGAPGIWNGTSTNGLPGTRGEGVIVGIIDSGINSDHPSFADVGGDGYNHTNPLGAGVYRGWCNPGFAVLMTCNDKLIGTWSYAASGNNPEDDDGHGSHTASTTAGNVIMNATLVVPTNSFVANISGVAPHANIIAYDACAGSCPGAALLAAANQTVLDGVDVINYSISGGNTPYADSVSLAFLNATAAGIFVSASAGNDGPGVSTNGHSEPWVQTVAASTHNRLLENGLINMSGGVTPPANMFGKSPTSGYGPAPIVYAGNFGDPLCPIGAFAPGTFTNQIVVCDRGGGIARVDKAQSVLNGGADGFVLANDLASGNGLVVDPYALPGVHLTYNQGVTLKAWLASGSGHTATIQGTVPDYSASNGDIMASFSSRGPSLSVPDVIKPDVTAPGVDIWAAIENGGMTPPPEYGFNSGTSMSSPHSAGSAALMVGLHPTWTPAEIKSALMMTSINSGVLKEDEVTPATPFDMGAGRIALSQAGLAGLVLNETQANFTAANPALGGNPATLNLASMAEDGCPTSCSWLRTMTSRWTSTRTWTASISAPGGMVVNVSPSAFTIAPNASQVISVTVDATALATGSWYFATLTWSDGAGGANDAHMPIAIYKATPLVVTTTTDELNTDGDCSLREAVRAANTNLAVDACPAGSASATDVINLGANTYRLTLTGAENAALTGDLDVTGNLIINGVGAGSTIIEGGVSAATAVDRVFELPNTGVALELNRMTIRNGRPAAGGSAFGGAIRSTGALTLKNCTVSGNQAPNSSGGAIQITDGSLTINTCTISGNSATAAGGGINNQSFATITNSTISGNTLTSAVGNVTGGGIRNGANPGIAAVVTIQNSTITGNNATTTSATGQAIGAGIENELGTATSLTVVINNSTISSNTGSGTNGSFGGGMLSQGSATSVNVFVTLNNSTVNNNQVANSGAGIYMQHGTLVLNNSTVSGNTGASFGGGLMNISGTNSRNTTTTLNNATFANNTGTTGAAIRNQVSAGVTANATVNFRNSLIGTNSSASCSNSGTGATLNSTPGYNLDAATTCIDAVSPGNLQNATPALAALTNNGGTTQTMAPLPGSAAIDAGNPAGCSDGTTTFTTDQRGEPRPVDYDNNANSRCDIGAFERQADETGSVSSMVLATTYDLAATLARVRWASGSNPGTVTVVKRNVPPGGGLAGAGELPTYWQVTASGSGYTVDLTFCYTNWELGVLDENNLLFYRFDGTTWQNMGFSSRDTLNNCVTLNGVTALSAWTLATSAPTAVNVQQIDLQSGQRLLLPLLLGLLLVSLTGLVAYRRRPLVG